MHFSHLRHLKPVKQAYQARTAGNLFFFMGFLSLIYHIFVRALNLFSLSIPWYLKALRSWRLAALISNELRCCLHLLKDQSRPGRGASRAGAPCLSSNASCFLWWLWHFSNRIHMWRTHCDAHPRRAHASHIFLPSSSRCTSPYLRPSDHYLSSKSRVIHLIWHNPDSGIHAYSFFFAFRLRLPQNIFGYIQVDLALKLTKFNIYILILFNYINK